MSVHEIEIDVLLSIILSLWFIPSEILIMNSLSPDSIHLPQCATNCLIREQKEMRAEFRALLIKKSGAKVQIKSKQEIKNRQNFSLYPY